MTLPACSQNRPDTFGQGREAYQYSSPSRDGIGKYYMGREISQTMGHRGASWLDRPERSKEEDTDRILKFIKNLKLPETAQIADIGAGSGYYSLELAERYPQGMVWAVDIQQEMLDILENKAKKQGVENVKLLIGSETHTNLPKEQMDMVLLVDVYHEFSYPKEMLTSIYESLKPDGSAVLLEFKAEDPQIPIKRLHKMSLSQAQREFEASGFRLEEKQSNLPWQHFLVFKKME